MSLATIPTSELRAELSRRNAATLASADPCGPLVARLVSKAADFYLTRPALVMSPSRCRTAVLARWAVWHVLRGQEYGFSHLGRLFGRDHAAIMHGCRQAELLKARSARFRAALEEVKAATLQS